MSLAAGSRLGSHEIPGLLGGRRHGRGLSRARYQAESQGRDQGPADAHASDPERIARFNRDAQVVAALNHAGIAAIYDLAETDPQGTRPSSISSSSMELAYAFEQATKKRVPPAVAP